MARKLSWGRKTDLGVSLSIKKGHHEVSGGMKKKPPCTCHPICNRLMNEKRQQQQQKDGDGDLVVTWCTFSVRNEATLLKPTSFADKLYSQSENSSIEV